MKAKKIKFGDIINFTEVYDSAVYLDIHDSKNFDLKLYTTNEFIESNTIQKANGTELYKRSYRKIIFRKEIGQGIVIGQTKKLEGLYIPQTGGTVYSYYPTEYEPAYLDNKLTYTFWIVAVDLNKTVLVPKVK